MCTHPGWFLSSQVRFGRGCHRLLSAPAPDTEDALGRVAIFLMDCEGMVPRSGVGSWPVTSQPGSQLLGSTVHSQIALLLILIYSILRLAELLGHPVPLRETVLECCNITAMSHILCPRSTDLGLCPPSYTVTGSFHLLHLSRVTVCYLCPGRPWCCCPFTITNQSPPTDWLVFCLSVHLSTCLEVAIKQRSKYTRLKIR